MIKIIGIVFLIIFVLYLIIKYEIALLILEVICEIFD